MLNMKAHSEARDAIAAEIRAWLGRRNMTQRDLEQATGLSRSTIGLTMNCRRDVSIPEVMAIADALGVDWIRLLQDAQDALDLQRPQERGDLAAG